jgi:hypothetical protein
MTFVRSANVVGAVQTPKHGGSYADANCRRETSLGLPPATPPAPAVAVHRFSMDALRKKTAAAIPRSRVRQVAVANRTDFDGGGLRQRDC